MLAQIPGRFRPTVGRLPGRTSGPCIPRPSLGPPSMPSRPIRPKALMVHRCRVVCQVAGGMPAGADAATGALPPRRSSLFPRVASAKWRLGGIADGGARCNVWLTWKGCDRGRVALPLPRMASRAAEFEWTDAAVLRGELRAHLPASRARRGKDLWERRRLPGSAMPRDFALSASCARGTSRIILAWRPSPQRPRASENGCRREACVVALRPHVRPVGQSIRRVELSGSWSASEAIRLDTMIDR